MRWFLQFKRHISNINYLDSIYLSITLSNSLKPEIEMIDLSNTQIHVPARHTRIYQCPTIKARKLFYSVTAVIF